ncbi:MAG: bifunctional glutamate N-acetyltransferase/amino-acid acetyltransferase ArgJ [Eubacterium sp.]|nr:bifunctional glutamate N-acetyltransferase/amino-acid acetyltransferase ArgJ [Eubacterium sp.]
MVRKVEGGILAAKGYSVASMNIGIKAGNKKRDLTLIKSDVPATVVGTFTRNIVKAAPVRWDMEVVERGLASAIVINTGIANAATGEEGYKNCRKEADAVGVALDVKPEQVLTASTGVIGPQIPVDKIIDGVNELAKNMVGVPYSDSAVLTEYFSGVKANAFMEASEAAKAIMTTDTVPKEVAVEFELGGKVCHIGAMCKGSGMIHPNMGTMLGFILADIDIEKELAQRILRAVIERTFNMVSVDGDTSTNDTVVWLSNGLAGNDKLTADALGISLDQIDETGDTDISSIEGCTDDYKELYKAIYTICEHLAKCIAEDGEGATRLFTAKVVGAPDYKTAKILAKSIITSNLTKAAIYGRDANCGRIFCAMGYSGAKFDPDKTDIIMESGAGSIKLISQGKLPEFSEEEALRILSPDEITAICNIHDGEYEAVAWGCDLTHEYVTINADYRS